MKSPTHTVALVNGRAQVIVKDGQRTLRIHLFARVEDAEAFRRKCEQREARVRFPVNELEYRARPAG